jgi:hypothetical protein
MVVALDRIDNRIYKPDTLSKRGFKVLGIIPDLGRQIREEFAGESYIQTSRSRLATTLVTVHSPLTAVAESYRHLRNQLQVGSPGEKVLTIVVTSANMGEENP